MADVPKFIKGDDGKLKKNPEWLRLNGKAPQSAAEQQQVTVVPTVTDMVEHDLPMTTETTDAVEFIQERDFLERYKLANGSVPDSDQILNMLEKLFETLEIPVGQLNKLMAMALDETIGEVILDDSGSMGSRMTKGSSAGKTRWEEAVDQLRFITQVFSILRLKLRVRGLNRCSSQLKSETPVNLQGVKEVSFVGRPVQEVDAEWNAYCEELRRAGPTRYATPTKTVLKQVFDEVARRGGHTSLYLIFDGCPSDATTEEMCDLLLNRKRPEPKKCPITMIGCTDNDEDLEWASEVEEQATNTGHPSYLSTLDDYEEERKEVLHDQGKFFIGFYTKGTYRICQIYSAQDPYGLDALDDDYPFTWGMINGLMGRELSEQEYDEYLKTYFNNEFRTPEERADCNKRYGHLRNQLKSKTTASTDIPEIAKYIADKGKRQSEKRKKRFGLF